MSEEKKKKYNVNLPKTSFPMKASLSSREPERLKLWSKEGLEEKIKEKSDQSEGKYILHDGPPYANGKIHIGHALNKVLKDMIVRYQSHKGLKTTYVPGWDCHGLPIEHALLKELGQDKNDVDQMEFRKKAKSYASKFVKTQMKDFQRLGIFAEWKNPYLTMAKHYQASIARSFFELYNKGYIYRGEKPVYWSIGCETALAEAELEYQDKTSKAIFVHFPIVNNNFLKELGLDEATSTSFMIWTTTPWTLPANVGIAIHPDLEYGVYKINDNEVSIFCSALKNRIEEKLELQNVECLKSLTGKELKQHIDEYQHPFIDRAGKVIEADYVSAEDGTGIVHIAPGHGEDDYIFGHLKAGLEILSPVNAKGQFLEDFNKDLKLKGMNVFEANTPIIEHLKSKKLLKKIEDHQHSYPFCWRSKTPVIVRSTPQWFLKVDHQDLRKKVIDAIEDNSKTSWYPDWGKNRILKMIETRPDWCLSRQRLWGVPIPIAYKKDTDEVYYSDSFRNKVLELFEQEGADAWFSHPKEDFFDGDKTLAESLEFETDILDVWFDSGVSHQAVLETGHKLGFPCELYLEGSDQHRGWFQTSLITSMALRGQSPFKNVLTHGFVVDGQGKKMSKSEGNVVSPQEVIEKFGADVLRLWVSSCDTNSDIRLSSEIIDRMAEAYRKIRNTFRFLLGNIADFNPEKENIPFEKMHSLDQWVLSRLNQVSKEVTDCYESFKFHKIYQIIYDFCISDLSSFYLDSLKDRMYCSSPDDPLRKSSQSAMHIIAKALCQLLSPILVFTTDEIWRTTFDENSSIHEKNWDTSLWENHSKENLNRWNTIRSIRRNSDLVIEKLRETKEVGSSLDCIVHIDSKINEELKKFTEDLELGLIVSQVQYETIETENKLEFDLEWTTSEDKPRSDKVTVYISKASGEKCGRCWRFDTTVGTTDTPELCERCTTAEKVVSSLNS